MALTSQIDAAANPRRAPVGGDNLSSESVLLSMPARERTAEQQRRRDEKDQRDRRTAGVNTAGTLLDHPCELDPPRVTRCGHPDHDRDADAVRQMLDVLGLACIPPRPAEADATEKECTRCRETQPLDQFVHTIGGTDGAARVTAQCKTCRVKYCRPRKEISQ